MPRRSPGFCTLTYDVSFPLFAKVEVNGGRAEPLFTHLMQARPGLFGTRAIKWNFNQVPGRPRRAGDRALCTAVKPEALEAAVGEALAEPA